MEKKYQGRKAEKVIENSIQWYFISNRDLDRIGNGRGTIWQSICTSYILMLGEKLINPVNDLRCIFENLKSVFYYYYLNTNYDNSLSWNTSHDWAVYCIALQNISFNVNNTKFNNKPSITSKFLSFDFDYNSN